MRKRLNSAIDPADVEFLRVSEKLVTARYIESGLMGLIILAITTVPLILRLIGVWEGYPAWLGWGLPAAVALSIVVPYGRMQYVDVTMGPLERMLGLSTIHLHTASPGTNAQLNGLPAAEAARLREQLSALGEAKLAGL